ncbi:MAG: hypothetical protein LBC38_04305 [Oscillospiraceae bacterium]|jgi:cytochrome bd-type quinol oxidase subunit 2|nr:hypothetical protein [Oscillospiraceae bacterium]
MVKRFFMRIAPHSMWLTVGVCIYVCIFGEIKGTLEWYFLLLTPLITAQAVCNSATAVIKKRDSYNQRAIARLNYVSMVCFCLYAIITFIWIWFGSPYEGISDTAHLVMKILVSVAVAAMVCGFMLGLIIARKRKKSTEEQTTEENDK